MRRWGVTGCLSVCVMAESLPPRGRPTTSMNRDASGRQLTDPDVADWACAGIAGGDDDFVSDLLDDWSLQRLGQLADGAPLVGRRVVLDHVGGHVEVIDLPAGRDDLAVGRDERGRF